MKNENSTQRFRKVEGKRRYCEIILTLFAKTVLMSPFILELIFTFKMKILHISISIAKNILQILIATSHYRSSNIFIPLYEEGKRITTFEMESKENTTFLKISDSLLA